MPKPGSISKALREVHQVLGDPSLHCMTAWP